MLSFPSRYPTRVHLRCETCGEGLVLSLHVWQRTHPFCPRDLAPLTVVAVTVGVLREEPPPPDVVGRRPASASFA